MLVHGRVLVLGVEGVARAVVGVLRKQLYHTRVLCQPDAIKRLMTAHPPTHNLAIAPELEALGGIGYARKKSHPFILVGIKMNEVRFEGVSSCHKLAKFKTSTMP